MRGAPNVTSGSSSIAHLLFYRSPFDGRVFFDPPLGPPWPKHWCTDSRRRAAESPRSPAGNVVSTGTAGISVARPKFSEALPHDLGWEPRAI